MKSSAITISPSEIGSRLRHLPRFIASFARNGASEIRTWFSNFHTNLQIGRMEVVLGNLSDEQLARIGLKRSDIKRHAEFLISYEYDGL